MMCHVTDVRQLSVGQPIMTRMRAAVVCWLVFIASVEFTTGSLAPSIPTDNPVETLYGEGVYAWTGSINWTQVVG